MSLFAAPPPHFSRFRIWQRGVVAAWCLVVAAAAAGLAGAWPAESGAEGRMVAFALLGMAILLYLVNARNLLQASAWGLIATCGMLLVTAALWLSPAALPYLAVVPLLAGVVSGPRGAMVALLFVLGFDVLLAGQLPGLMPPVIVPGPELAAAAALQVTVGLLGRSVARTLAYAEKARSRLMFGESRSEPGLAGPALDSQAMFQRRMFETFAAFRRYKAHFSLLLLDIDQFKALHERHGQAFADQAMLAVASALQGSVRETDLVAHYGPQELAVILTHTDVTGAAVLADRLRQMVGRLDVRSAKGETVPVTVSIGMAVPQASDRDAGMVVARAEAAMHQARDRGRNQVIVAS